MALSRMWLSVVTIAVAIAGAPAVGGARSLLPPASAPGGGPASDVAGDVIRAPDPSATFAADVTAAARAGWQLARVVVADDEAEVRLALTLVRERAAERFELTLTAGGRRALSYARQRVVPPGSPRVYSFAGELFDALSDGRVIGLTVDCGAYYVETVGRSASVDPFDYYEVSASARGRAAQRMLGRVLGGNLGDGMQLSAVLESTEVPRGAARAVDVVLYGNGEQILHVGLSPRNLVVSLEIREAPVAYRSWAVVYPAGAQLARALAAAPAVSRVAFETNADGGEPRVTFGMANEREYVIDLGAFEPDGEMVADCDC